MPLDIGIDLGTTKVIVYEAARGIVFREPSIVAINSRNGDILSIGTEASKMVGRTPSNIKAIHPLSDGVISDYRLTNAIINYAIKKVCGETYFKPRVAICVPSIITDVESRAVVDAAYAAGARKVYLIEEPIAAAIGANIDISSPCGHMVVDIGGGTTDVAVLSMNGIVCKNSIRLAGIRFDQELIHYIRMKHNLVIGERMAEEAKKAIGTCWSFDDDRSYEVKGRSIITGMPGRATIRWEEISQEYYDLANQLAEAITRVFEKTPPELSGDIKNCGITLTGGGSRLNGLDKYLSKRFGVECRLAENPEECVAIGTGLSFKLLGLLSDGIASPSNRLHD